MSFSMKVSLMKEVCYARDDRWHIAMEWLDPPGLTPVKVSRVEEGEVDMREVVEECFRDALKSAYDGTWVNGMEAWAFIAGRCEGEIKEQVAKALDSAEYY